MLPKEDITGILLAGGRSSRMGSDKGFLMLEGEYFTARIAKAMAPFVREIIIVTNRVQYDLFNLKRVEDLIKDSGPIGGIHSGLSHSETDWNLIMSCDIPMINESVIEYLIQGFDPESDITLLKYLDNPLPLIALYKKSCLSLCEQLLYSGERRLMELINSSSSKIIELTPELGVFTDNINTPQQLKKAKHAVEH